MKSEDKLKKLLVETAKKEKRDYRRATIYIAIPVLVGTIWLSYSIIKVWTLEGRRAALETHNAILQQLEDATKAAIADKQEELVETNKALVGIKGLLEDCATEKSSCKQKAAAALNLVQQTQTSVESAISPEAITNPSPSPAASPTSASLSTIPNVTGLSAADAEQRTRVARLTVRKVDQPGRGTPGTVMYQDPLPGKQVPAGTELSIYVAPELVEVPKLLGLSAADAAQRIRQGKLSVRNVPQPGKGTPGTVLYQDPLAGKQVAAGTEVSIYVIPAPPNQ